MSDPLLLQALRREKVARPPIWLMRQAGRYMAEYRAVREGVSFLELCKRPKLCAEVMQTAVEKIGVDAAIIFSDLLPILEPMGFDLSFAAGDGPQIANPFREKDDLARVNELVDVSSLDFVYQTVEETRRAVSPLPVIGFAGAPFTLAGYAIEGGTSRQFLRTKTLMRAAPDVWKELLSRLARSSARYLIAQIEAGAQVVQIFDSWVGCLGVEDFRRFVLPSLKELRDMLNPGVTVIYFGTGNPALLPSFAEIGTDCVGVDWRVPIDRAWELVGKNRAIQGNLNPVVLLASQDVIRAEATRILDAVGDQPGFVFNLGHGILKETPVENVVCLVNVVKNWRKSS
ncbi:MAG: uroporphyrinogen decarboxylase [Thermoguttaceae bacterium]|nr:uroporphyrinogen decarboxylase [Thermoguttaceae bacterium]